MGREPGCSGPSFFKVLIRDDYTTRLRLPHGFVRKYGKSLGENAKLSSCGETWKVNIVEEESSEDDDVSKKYLCFIGGGWTKFVRDFDLRKGEFIVLWLNLSHSITSFDVSVYGTNCCQRLLSDDHHDHFESNDGKMKSELEESNPELYFEIVLKKYQQSRVALSKRFCAAAGLSEAKCVRLEYAKKQYYQQFVKLDCRRYSIDLAKGWCEFRKACGLVIGKTYSFHFNPTKNLIQVNRVLK